MPHEVFVFGDSHWRVFFPFLNTGEPGVCHEQDGIVTLDTTGSQLSGATMWSLLRDDSRHGARRRILETIDCRGEVENVGLVFGEVDVRYHSARYFRDAGDLRASSVFELVTRYKRFIDEDLLASGRVTGHVFVYFGFRYPLLLDTPPISGSDAERTTTICRMMTLTSCLEGLLPAMLRFGPLGHRIVPIVPGNEIIAAVDSDGVHLVPEAAFNGWVLPAMREVLR